MSSKARSQVVWFGGVPIIPAEASAIPRITLDASAIPQVYMSVSMKKEHLFDKPFVYSLVTNASGVITDYASSGVITASSSALISALGNNVGWSASGYRSTSYIFNGKQSTEQTLMASGAVSIGNHIISLGLQVLRYRNDNMSVFDVVHSMPDMVASIRNLVAGSLVNHLTSTAAQVKLLNMFIQMNGPVVNGNTLGSKVKTFTVQSTLENVTLGFVIRDFQLAFSFSGQVRQVVLNDIPVMISLT